MNWVGGDYCPTGAVRADRCVVEPRGVEFCIDQHEYPNQQGVLPSVMVSFEEAAHYCSQEGKRLCSEGEWTFACRGTRKLAACNYGQATPRLHPAAFWDPSTVAAVLAANEGRRASGPSACRSPWGVFDLLGNVDEWATSEHVHGYAAALKGGRYNQSSIGCERSFQTRKPELRYPRTGFRCCTDPLVRIPEVP
jgi:formylglycine-generating enzyme required for sulfatase activity